MNTTRAFAKPLIALLLTTFLLIAGMPNSAFGESTSMVYSTQSLTDSFLPTDDNMSTDLSLENDSFYLDIAVDEYPDPISFSGKLCLMTLATGDSYLVGEAGESQAFSLDRLLINIDSIDITIYNSHSGKYYSTRTAVSGDLQDQIAELMNSDDVEKISSEQALDLYSLGTGCIQDDSNSGTVEATDSAISTRSSYNGYRLLLDDLNSGKTVSLSNYDVDASDFKGSGWSQINTNNYIVSIYSKANGSTEYLSQVALLQVNNVHYSGYSYGGSSIVYVAGCTVSYSTITNKVSPVFIDLGIDIKNVKLALGDLKNAVFSSLTTNMLTTGGTAYNLLKLLQAAPITSISNWFDLLSLLGSESTNTQVNLGLFVDQLARREFYTALGLQTTGGSMLNRASSSIGNCHHVTLNVWTDPLDQSKSVSWTTKWSYNSSTSL